MSNEFLELKTEKEFELACGTLNIDRKLSSGRVCTLEELKTIETYLTAFIGLYGIVPIKTAAELISGYEETELTEQDITRFERLFSHMEVFFFFNNDYIGNKEIFYFNFINHFDSSLAADDFADLKQAQQGKPYAVLPKKKLLFYAEEDYFEVPPQYGQLFNFIKNEMGIDEMLADEITDEVYYICRANGNADSAFDVFERANVDFENDADREKFFSILFEMRDNTRTWEDCGHTPKELREIFAE